MPNDQNPAQGGQQTLIPPQPQQAMTPAPMNTGAMTQRLDPAQIADIYERYGNFIDRAGLPILKFIDGSYLIGANRIPVALGTPVLFDVPNLQVGWLKWHQEEIMQDRMGYLSHGHRPENRDMLGDLDQSQWERDRAGRPRDPWQYSHSVPIQFCAGYEVQGISEAVFATSSKGGNGAVGRVCKAYAERVKFYPDTAPIVQLFYDTYYHKDFGRYIAFPMLFLCGWNDNGPQPDLNQPQSAQAVRPGPQAPQGIGNQPPVQTGHMPPQAMQRPAMPQQPQPGFPPQQPQWQQPPMQPPMQPQWQQPPQAAPQPGQQPQPGYPPQNYPQQPEPAHGAPGGFQGHPSQGSPMATGPGPQPGYPPQGPQPQRQPDGRGYNF